MTSVVGWDPAHPESYAAGEPHQFWDRMRTQSPVAWSPPTVDRPGFWSVTSMATVSEVLRDSAAFTAERGTVLALLGTEDPAGGRQLAVTDPPRHTAMRTLVQRSLSPRSLRSMRPRIEAEVERLLAPLDTDEPVDVAAVAAPLPLSVAGPMLGVPAEDWPTLSELAMLSVAPDDPVLGRARTGAAALGPAHHRLFAYFSDLVDQRRGDLGDDLVSDLLRTRMPDGRPLATDEVVANCYGLVLGAVVTTPQVLAGMVLAAARGAELGDPAADAGDLVEEALRWTSPARHFMRYTVTDLELGGVPLPAGAPVAAWISAANRDPKVFADPHEFRVGRRPNHHIAFGVGPHYCIGHSVARLALGAALRRVRAGFAGFDLVEEPQHLHSPFIAGITRLVVAPRPRSHGPDRRFR